MANYKVKNLNGTSSLRYAKPPSGCSSWIDYWEKRSGQKAFACSRDGCKINTTITSFFNINGAHVQLAIGNKDWYIVPLCPMDNHHSNKGEFIVKGPLVPVEEKGTILW